MTETRTPQRANYKGKKILAVDDALFIRKMFFSMLERKGFKVHSAVDGADAVKKALKIKPDIIFLDIMMPEVDGFQALDMLRKMEQTRQIPVIIVTARADTTTLLKAIKLGANDFIAKPFTRTMIMRKVRLALLSREEREKLDENERNLLKKYQPTFIDTAIFRELKSNYINKLDQLFMKMVRFLAQQEKLELVQLIKEMENSFKVYEIQQPLPILKEMQPPLRKNQWKKFVKIMEKLYQVFQELQKSKNSSPD